uniref:Uncharacterized protein n=1 Tax=Arundo donax TaxID=35708 RepID=A0A0A9EGX5_ARUDO
MSSCHAALRYSSIIEPMSILSGYSFFNCLNSFSIVSRGRSLMSSMFCHPMIRLLPAPFGSARSLA